ncbi:hypothetical protein V8E53_009962 [Lactarius tabidus]
MMVPSIMQAAEKSLALLKSSPPIWLPECSAPQLLVLFLGGYSTLDDLLPWAVTTTTDGWHADDLLRSVFLGCATKNAKVITIAWFTCTPTPHHPQAAVPSHFPPFPPSSSQRTIAWRWASTYSSTRPFSPSSLISLLGCLLMRCYISSSCESSTAIVSSTAAAMLRQLSCSYLTRLSRKITVCSTSTSSSQLLCQME